MKGFTRNDKRSKLKSMPVRAIHIKASSWYTLQDIVRMGVFPWCKSFWSVRNIVAGDRARGNILKAVITGTGRATKYHFKGENIIRFVKDWERAGVTHSQKPNAKRTAKNK